VEAAPTQAILGSLQTSRRETPREPVLTTNAVSSESPDHPNSVWRFLRALARIAFAVWLRLRVRGRENLPSHGAALLLINHQSHLDSMLVGTPINRPISYLARDSLFRVPIVGWILKHTYTTPLNREAASSSSIRAATDRLKHGFLVGIFPEGTRSTDGQIAPLKPGFIALLRRADVPVIPVAVAGSGAAFPRQAWFVRPKPCRVVFGEPIPAATLAPLCERGNEEALLEEVRRRMRHCYEEADDWLKGSRSHAATHSEHLGTPRDR
jgi:1-acyl-sn-glycerol-3-phosphate acyltransferase